jgi:hypothetical protein
MMSDIQHSGMERIKKKIKLKVLSVAGSCQFKVRQDFIMCVKGSCLCNNSLHQLSRLQIKSLISTEGEVTCKKTCAIYFPNEFKSFTLAEVKTAGI